MCIALFASSPLQVAFMHEQIWINPKDQEFNVTECYDLLFANRGTKPIEEITLLSPHLLVKPGTKARRLSGGIKFPEPGLLGCRHYDWYLREYPFRPPKFSKKRVKFVIPWPDRIGGSRFRAVDCVPVIPERVSPLFLRNKAARDTIVKLKFTALKIALKSPIQPHRTVKKPYWMRIELKPHELNHRIKSKRFRIGGQETQILSVQPCEIPCPRLIVGRLERKLQKVLNKEKIAKPELSGAKAIWERLIENGFRRFGNTVRYGDYRISVVASEKALIMNSYVSGPVYFAMVRPTDDDVHYAHMWQTGANYYHLEDPVRVATSVYQFLRKTFGKPEESETFAQISNRVGGGSVPKKVYYVLKILWDRKYINTKNNGMSWYCTKEVTEEILLEDYMLVSRLMGGASFSGRTKRPYFPVTPYLIQYTLLW